MASMNIEEALSIIEALSAGCDPQTGEGLSRSDILCRSDVSDALVTITEALQVIRSAVTTEEAGSKPPPDVNKESEHSAYEAAKIQFNIDATGGPKRFTTPGWFYIGPAVAYCPKCRVRTEAFRKPYTTRAGLRFHFWALLCLECQYFFRPIELGAARKTLYGSSQHRPTSDSGQGPLPDQPKTVASQEHVSTRLCDIHIQHSPGVEVQIQQKGSITGTLSEEINEIIGILSEEISETDLVEYGEQQIENLLKIQRSGKQDFDERDVEILHHTEKQIKEIKVFTEELDDLPYLQFKEEVDEAVDLFRSIVHRVDGWKIAGRINKEIRALAEKRGSLPTRAEFQQNGRLQKGKRALESNPPTCSKHPQHKMVLRESNDDYFWGCPEFPSCWHKRSLTKEQRGLLG